jgi:hypothetical protein
MAVFHAERGATADENAPLTPQSWGGTALPPKLGGWGAIFRADDVNGFGSQFCYLDGGVKAGLHYRITAYPGFTTGPAKVI